ncbi:MAG: transcription termination/antitermination NusG family protein [Porticoccaceae bacterium]
MTQAARHPQPRHQSGPRWYAVRTKPRQEGRARANLENQGFAVYLPHTWLDRRKAGRWQRVREVLFPGYLFIAVDAAHQAMAPIRSTPGVLDLVRQGTEPLPVADAIIEQLHTAEAKLGEGGAPPQPFRPGDPLTIVGGPLAGLAGTFQMANASDRVQVLVNILGGEKSVAVNIHHLGPAEA